MPSESVGQLNFHYAFGRAVRRVNHFDFDFDYDSHSVAFALAFALAHDWELSKVI